MFGASIKILSGIHKKMVNLRPAQKNFWTKKQKPKVSSSQLENSPVRACGESPSKCLDSGYGKPLPKPNKSLLNFCRGKPEIKEKPSNCDEKECEKRETFLEYLFGKRDKKPKKISFPAVKYILCREYSAPKVQELLEPQPMSASKFPAPKAVNTMEFVKKSQKIPSTCSAAALFIDQYSCESSKKCKKIEAFKVPFEQLRPSANTKEKFSCRTGVDHENIFKPMKRNCCVEAAKVGRVTKFPGEIPKPPSLNFNAESLCNASPKKFTRTSRVEKLKALVSSSKHCPVPSFKDSK
ncbi:uncharacterized protein LOC107042289 [Diachasma alloeum]|uniref:uncharacterized protein LOC107042289 n=1 Tax=Diachasma alloeum TaxID=454923 RepID=UPI00073810F4|nr:uncharacterized protein LOC107042289 [Diachasma alloeum]